MAVALNEYFSILVEKYAVRKPIVARIGGRSRT
jgi:hypothetical protein